MDKITDFQQCIGKTIHKIEDDQEVIRMTFKDGGFIELDGDYCACVYLNNCLKKTDLISPKVYESSKQKDLEAASEAWRIKNKTALAYDSKKIQKDKRAV